MLGVVLVPALDPHLEPLALVATPRRAVEDSVVGHQELDAATGGRVGLINGLAVKREGVEAVAFGQVADEVGSASRALRWAIGGKPADWGDSTHARVCSSVLEKPSSRSKSLP